MSPAKLPAMVFSLTMLAALTVFNLGLPQAGIQRLQHFSTTGKYWTAVSHFDSNYGGFQVSSAKWMWLAFNNNRKR